MNSLITIGAVFMFYALLFTLSAVLLAGRDARREREFEAARRAWSESRC